MSRLRAIKTFIIVAVLLVAASCSTQKASWPNVRYHQMTCRYNVWWNGNESLKEGVRLLEQKHVDDYTRILPVYRLGTKEQAQSVNPQMDKAIEKGIKGIKKHSIYVKGHEYVAQIPKCYLLTAYASFYKKDIAAASNTCRLIVAQYGGTQEADEAQILLARCLTLDKQYPEAESMLDQMVSDLNDGDFPAKLAYKLYPAQVECALPQEKYKKAVQYLRLSLDNAPDHYSKARYYYIMAQIYQHLDKRPTASKYFAKVLTCRPDYIMEFNARISMASCSDAAHTDVAQMEKSLNKMLADKKNEDFRDQIYYAKGEMYMGVKDAQKACDNLRLSVASAASNPSQKAKSAIRLGDILYEYYENYDLAQCYYDTAIQIITVEYPNYSMIRSRYDVLTSLVENTRLIHLNDSLIAMADMSPKERGEMIKKRIEELKKAEKAEKERRLLQEIANEAKAQQNTLQGDWYFYNSNTVSKGKESFRQRWGNNRVLEDYWFMSKKSSLGMQALTPGLQDSGQEDEEADSAAVASTNKTVSKDDPNDPHNEAYYLKDLPKTQGRRDTMNYEISQALLNAGYLYNEAIGNTPRALECYLRMVEDYPSTDNIVQAFYQLYRIYSKQGNTPRANYYRDMVLMGFPDSDYANLIRNEDYYLEIIKRAQYQDVDYAEVYSLYRSRRYNNVIEYADKVLRTYPESITMAKCRYWKALALAQIGETDTAVTILRGLIDAYPAEEPIVPLAQAQIRIILGEKDATPTEEITDTEEALAQRSAKDPLGGNNVQNQSSQSAKDGSELPPESRLYRYKPNQQHYVLVIVNDRKIQATTLQYQLADFNASYYANSGYRSSPLMFTDSTQMLTIHRFKDAAEAVDYWHHLMQPESPLLQYDKNDYQIFPISNLNYATLYNRKDVAAYLRFFNYYYEVEKGAEGR